MSVGASQKSGGQTEGNSIFFQSALETFSNAAPQVINAVAGVGLSYFSFSTPSHATDSASSDSAALMNSAKQFTALATSGVFTAPWPLVNTAAQAALAQADPNAQQVGFEAEDVGSVVVARGVAVYAEDSLHRFPSGSGQQGIMARNMLGGAYLTGKRVGTLDK